MSKFLIKIDRNSIKENPDAGQTSFFIPGAVYKTATGWARHIQQCHQMTPDPNYLFNYEDCEVECTYCKEKFSYKDLKSKEAYDFEYDEDYTLYYVCPKCNEPDCCDFEYEKIDDVLNEIRRAKS